jgi:hypothetical protein
MANLILLWDDAITEIASVDIESHSTEVTGYVAENLLDRDRQTVFKSSVTDPADALVEFDLKSDVVIKGFALLNHNASTIGADTLSVNYHTQAEGAGASNEWFTTTVSSAVGDDDFFIVPASSITARYVRVFLHNANSSGTYMGRVFLARETYDYAKGLRIGSSKGGISPVDILETRGGKEHRILRGSRRKRLMASIPPNSGIATDRTNLVNLLDHIEGNYKSFVHSWPYGTTMYTGSNRYGMAVHARWANPEWLYQMLVQGAASLPIDTIEDK